MFLFRPKFFKFLSLIEMWEWLTHFSITTFRCNYDYMLKEGLTDSIFKISTFSMVLCSSFLHHIEIFPKAHNFLNKAIVKQCSFVVNYFERTINTKFSTVNHCLTNSDTKN